MTNFHTLQNIGWSSFFQQQLSLEEWSDSIPARVIEQHKSLLYLATDTMEIKLQLTPNMPSMVVGDWVLLNAEQQFIRLLDRKTCFKRKSAGSKVAMQLISANIDTAFIVCSLNEDFNLSRIERYLALTYSADVEAVIVLSKADLIEAPEVWIDKIATLDKNLRVIALNTLDSNCIEQLSEWLGPKQTIVLLGSSGVGKSTLTNTLLGQQRQSTQSIREDDDKGKHTTTTRSLISLPTGALLLDTPGMRELQLTDCQEGIESVFADIEALANHCKFKDCQHQDEPNCAVKEAIEHGELCDRRYRNYMKLLREERLNSQSLAQKRANDKSFAKFVKHAVEETQKLRGFKS